MCKLVISLTVRLLTLCNLEIRLWNSFAGFSLENNRSNKYILSQELMLSTVVVYVQKEEIIRQQSKAATREGDLNFH